MKLNHLFAGGVVAPVLATAALAAPQTTLLVDPNVSSSGNGATWATAMDSLQTALDEASMNSSAANEYTILLREGTHRPPVQPGGDRKFEIDDTRWVRIIGGFVNETNPDNGPDGIGRRCILDGEAYTNAAGVSFDAAVHVFDLPGDFSEIGDEIRIENMTVQGGRARGGLGGAPSDHTGAGLIAQADDIRLELSDILFIDNEAGFKGSGFESRGGAIRFQQTGPDGLYLVRRCFFTGNSARRGGAVYLAGGRGYRFGSCTFTSNGKANNLPSSPNTVFDNISQPTLSGGAVFIENDTVSEFSNCLMYSNRAIQVGGAIHWRPFRAADMQPLTQLFSNCTIAQNWVTGQRTVVGGPAGPQVGYVYQSQRAAGIHVSPTSQAQEVRTITINNSILWGQGYGPDLVVEGESTPQVISGATAFLQFSNIENFQNVNTSGAGGVDPAMPGTIQLDPQYTSGPGLFRLSATSPCLNTGSNALIGLDIVDVDDDDSYAEVVPLDLAANPRIAGTPAVADMGAYERP